MATTKSLGRKNKFDKFYTKSEIVDQCLNLLNLNDYDCIIEPSAGNGSFSSKINNCKAYDISPDDNNIIKADWFELDKEQFKKFSNILVVGNPPFGVQNNLAIAFFNESAKFCNTIAFILPLTFKKDSVKNRLNLSFVLDKELILDEKSFLLNGESYSVPCVFQVWKKSDIPRLKVKSRTKSSYFDFVKKEDADFRIQRVGGNAGRADSNLNYSKESNYFIKNNSSFSNEELINIINDIDFVNSKYSVGPKSLSKTSLIETVDAEIDKIINT